MMPLLFRHLATSLSRQAANIGRFSPAFPPPAANAYRCLCTLTTAPRALLLSSARVTSIQPPWFGSLALSPPSLSGDCHHLPWVQPSAGMKTKTALKRRCKDCFFVRRRGRLFVFCKTNARHKQRQG